MKHKKPPAIAGGFLYRENVMLSVLGDGAFFFDTSLLTGKSAEVVQLSATNLTNLVHYDAVDSG